MTSKRQKLDCVHFRREPRLSELLGPQMTTVSRSGFSGLKTRMKCSV